MSAVNRGLDRRAYAAEQRSIAAVVNELNDLKLENHRLRTNAEQVCLDRAEEQRLLRGLTKLMMKAHYNPQTEVLTITPLQMHEDADVSHTWLQIKRARQREGAPT